MRQLIERRAALKTELQGILSAHPETLPAEVETRWTALTTEAEQLEQRIARQSIVDDLDRRSRGTPTGTGDGSFDRQFSGVGLLDVMRAQMGGTDTGAMKARELSAELERRSGKKAQGLLWDMRLGEVERRTVTTTTPVGGVGGNLIADSLRSDLFIDRLREATAIRSLGARVIGGLVGNITLPRLSKSVVAAWTAENAEFPVSDPEFAGQTLSPRHFGVITELSRNMIQQTTPDAEELIRADQAKVLAAGLDAAAIAGSGTGAEPRGIVNTTGVTTTAIAGAMDLDDAADLIGAVDDANVLGGRSGFLGGTAVRRSAMKLKDGQGNPFGLATVFQGQPYAATNLAPAGTLVYSGDWSDLIVAFWSELDVLVNPFAEGPYKRGNVMVRSVLTCDLGVRHPESFAVATGIT
jgi:HK97 family phage major capsid protein